MNILVAIDDSTYSEAAVQAVLANHSPREAEVLVLHVLELVPYYVTQEMAPRHPAVLESLIAEARKAAQDLVAGAVEKFRAAGFRTRARNEEGDAKSVILDTAAQWPADLIVLGSHGRKGLERFLIGSVSEAVARHAPCSVEIVRLPAPASASAPAKQLQPDRAKV